MGDNSNSTMCRAISHHLVIYYYNSAVFYSFLNIIIEQCIYKKETVKGKNIHRKKTQARKKDT